MRDEQHSQKIQKAHKSQRAGCDPPTKRKPGEADIGKQGGQRSQGVRRPHNGGEHPSRAFGRKLRDVHWHYHVNETAGEKIKVGILV